MPKVKPYRCPVPGCSKKGTPSGLARHARVKHPEYTPEAYQTAVERAARGEPGFPETASQQHRNLRREIYVWVRAGQWVGLALGLSWLAYQFFRG